MLLRCNKPLPQVSETSGRYHGGQEKGRKKTNINTPIFNEIHKIVYENKKPNNSIIHLMKREAEEYNR